MHHEKELAAAVRAAMKKHNLNNEQLAARLNLSPTMIDRLLCGKIVPSRHLEKQLIEALGISDQRVKKMAERREKKSSASSAPARSAEKSATNQPVAKRKSGLSRKLSSTA